MSVRLGRMAGDGKTWSRWTFSIHCNKEVRTMRYAYGKGIGLQMLFLHLAEHFFKKMGFQGFPPWILDSPSFVSPYHIPLIPINSRLTVAICSYLDLPLNWSKTRKKSRCRENFSLVQERESNIYNCTTGPARWYTHCSTFLTSQVLQDWGIRKQRQCTAMFPTYSKEHLGFLGALMGAGRATPLFHSWTYALH